jgi:sulfide:quinone oxidoreductase
MEPVSVFAAGGAMGPGVQTGAGVLRVFRTRSPWSLRMWLVPRGRTLRAVKSGDHPLRVVVAGGGIAGAELLLALRSLAEERVEIEVVAPSTDLPFRPAATATPFGGGAVQVFDLETIAADAGAALRRDTVEAVAPRAHRVRLASGGSATYDALVVAVGARARAAVPGAITFRDQRDAHLVTALLDRLDPTGATRVVFAAPTGMSWTLPLYELALLTSTELDRRGVATEVVILTSEASPLEVFGPPASSFVASLLSERGIRKLQGSAQSVARGRVTLSDGESLTAEGVVAVPRLVGRRLAGVPADWNGFVETDERGRVVGLEDVFAAGDVTRFPVKQGGLATQQADVVAALLAARAGAGVPPPPTRSVLRARLLGAQEPCYLRTELDPTGRPVPSTQAPAVSDEADWWPAAKLFGRHLSPWMASRGLVAA